MEGLKSLLASLFFAWSVSANAASIQQYLPVNDVLFGTVHDIKAPPEAERLAAKMQKAVVADREWFLNFAKEHEGSGPLPYHPRLGLTSVEYQRLGELARKQELTPVGSIRIRLHPLEDGYKLISESGATPLDGLEIHPRANYVSTPYGELRFYSEINNTDISSPTGPWRGVQWKYETTVIENGARILLAMGKRSETEGILYYRVTTIKAEGKGENYFVFITYPLSERPYDAQQGVEGSTSLPSAETRP